MGRKIILTESELKKLIQRIVKEQGSMFGTAGTNIPAPSDKNDARWDPTKINAPSQVKAAPQQTVQQVQQDLISKGYKLPGKNKGVDGIEGYWTKKAKDYNQKDPTNGASKFNNEVAAWRAKIAKEKAQIQAQQQSTQADEYYQKMDDAQIDALIGKLTKIKTDRTANAGENTNRPPAS